MPRANAIYLGVDAGGTKTHALLADAAGRILGAGSAGPGNWESVGLDGAQAALKTAIRAALSSAGTQPAAIASAVYALAGLDWPSDEARLTEVVARLGLPGRRALINDAYAALRAGAPNSWGIVAIAGTGTVVAGRSPGGATFRTFGLGPTFGDLGGAGDLVRLALLAIAHAAVGRTPPTRLSQLFCTELGAANGVALIEGLSRGELAAGADLAPCVFRAAAEGDTAAATILHQVGAELAANIVAVARRIGLLETSLTLVLAGGVFQAQAPALLPVLLPIVRQAAPEVAPCVLHSPPVVGSVLLALEADGLEPDPSMQGRIGTLAAQALSLPRWPESI
jgi:N-acetylglucosamine kinase-like BadF-type ATPase